MFSADFVSGPRDFTQHLTSGVLILIHLGPIQLTLHLSYGVCRLRARAAKTLSSLLNTIFRL